MTDTMTTAVVDEDELRIMAGKADAYESLRVKAKALVEMLDEREKYHGSLIGQETLSLVNELRLEIAKWR